MLERNGVLPVRAQCLPFSQIPHTTRLFSDFLAYTPQVQRFYPHSPHFAEWSAAEAAAIPYNADRRERVSAILERQNKSWNAGAPTLSNIARLRAGAAAIVTGQQVGLFGGPMFSIYKALTAVKLVEEARAAGIDAVPIFWLATYDHDLQEVNHVSFQAEDGSLRTVSTSSHGVPGAPVSNVRFGDEILAAVEDAGALLGDTQALVWLRETYRPGETLGSAFGRLYAKLFAPWGVIVLDASDAELHRVAAPIYRAAIERAGELDAALLARGKELEQAGYHQQVKVTDSSTLVFTMSGGARTAIHRRERNGSGAAGFVIGTGEGVEKLSRSELLDRIAASPQNFSPNVLLRPVVQDYLLPTLAYTGGAAEAAYFAQAGAVYERLSGRVTPIVPRFSATIVGPRTQRWLRQYDIGVQDAFHGIEPLRRKLAARTLPQGVQAAFASAQKSVEQSLAGLRERLMELDATLADASQTSASKMNYQLNRLRQRATAAELRRSDVISRHAEKLSNTLYPAGALQERGIGGMFFVAKFGSELFQDILSVMRTDCPDHQLLEL